MSIILKKEMDTLIKMSSFYIFIIFKNACREGQPWTLEVFRLPRKIILQSLDCEESSVTISCSSFFVIDDTTIWKRIYHKLESWARRNFLNPWFPILQNEKKSFYSYLYIRLSFTCSRIIEMITVVSVFYIAFYESHLNANVRREDSRSMKPVLARTVNGCYTALWLLIF